MKRTILVILVAGLLLLMMDAHAANPEYARRVQELTAAYGFADWPGKGGPVRDGFRVSEDILPAGLALERADDPTAQVDPTSDRILVSRRYALAGGNGKITVDVAVAGTCVQAQGELLKPLVHNPLPQTSLVPSGAAFGLSLGDVCFVIPAGDVPVGVLWVRNNVFVRVTAQTSDMRSRISELAKALDTVLSRRPTFKSYAECPSRPVIGKVERVSDPVEVQTLEVDWKAAEVGSSPGDRVICIPSHRLFPADKMQDRDWASYQVAVSESNLIGFPLSGLAKWKADGPSCDKANAEVDAFLKKMERPPKT